ncbi:MAG: C4-dicarboxylate ABC transporter substrate-binding protein [Hyphomicrobium sp.]|nr:MAG: C4-dicarboxylate ABC transporter substrate-binding protein [Hyphomicrobium sp.]
MSVFRALLLGAAGAATVLAIPASAQQPPIRPPGLAAANRPAVPPKPAQLQLTERINQNTVTIISGNPNGAYLFVAYDMSAVLDDGDNLRVLPVVGKGGYQNVKDVLHLKGVDIGLTQSNIMSYLKRTGEFGSNIDQRLTYIAKLHNEQLHILAGKGINSLQDLAGKKVNLSDVGSGTQFSARLILEIIGLKVEEINVGQADGYQKVKTGEIAATVLIAGKPTGAFSKFKLEEGMKLLPLPYKDVFGTDYFPDQLTSDDYPGLIAKGETVETISVGAVLAAYNWPKDTDRYRKVAQFVNAFFGKFSEFHKPPRLASWKTMNIAANLNGWKRFPAAQEWLDVAQQAKQAYDRSTAVQQEPVTGPAPQTLQAKAATVVDPAIAREQAQRAAPNDRAAQEKLFKDYMEWVQQNKKP